MVLTLFCILGGNLAHEAGTPAFAFSETQGMRGLLGGAALMFVAFTGYGRIATLGEEVRQPARTIPRAIILTLCISMVLYLGVAYTGLGLLNAEQFAKAAGEGLAPLEIMARKMGDGKTVAAIVAVGAMTANGRRIAEPPAGPLTRAAGDGASERHARSHRKHQ